jgi:hypothetical protein
VEPVIVDTVRTYDEVSTYHGLLPRASRQSYYWNDGFTPYLGGNLKDDTYMIGGYVSAVSHSASRRISIDRANPVFIKGSPYTLYPIYGVRGVSLYYIGNTSNSVKLAVDTSGR